MLLNVNSPLGSVANVFLNGKKLEHCIEADDAQGVALVCYRDQKGEMVPEQFAEKGAMICQGIQVIRLSGKVEFQFDAAPETIAQWTEVEKTNHCKPVEVFIKS
jgi:hypothetical protein